MKNLTLPVVLAVLLPTGALAQGYVGIAGGATHIGVDCVDVDRCDRSDAGFKIHGGFKVRPNIAAELTYLRLGKAHASTAGSTDLALAVRSVGVGLAFGHDFTPSWSGVGRIGVARVWARESGNSAGAPIARNESSMQPYVGIAAAYAIRSNVSFDLALDFSRLKYGGDTGMSRMISAGFTFRF